MRAGRQEIVNLLPYLTGAKNFSGGLSAELPRVLREMKRRQADVAPETATPDPKAIGAIAAQIVAAGARRRGETPPPLPPVGSLARQILDAGMKRRGEDPDDQSRIPQDDQGAPNGGDDDDDRYPDDDDLDDDLTDEEREERRRRRKKKAKKRDPDDDDELEGTR